MLRLQVREIRGWLSGGSQDSGIPPMDPYTQNNLWLDSETDVEDGVDAVELVPDDARIADTRKSELAPSH